MQRYKITIETNPKRCEEELGRILLLLNNFIDKEKSVMLAKLFKAYVEKIVIWNEFCEYSEIINRLFIQDINLLKMIYNETVSDTTNRSDLFRVERLNSLGIIGLSFKSTRMTTINGVQQENRQDSYLTMNNNGKKFMDIING